MSGTAGMYQMFNLRNHPLTTMTDVAAESLSASTDVAPYVPLELSTLHFFFLSLRSPPNFFSLRGRYHKFCSVIQSQTHPSFIKFVCSCNPRLGLRIPRRRKQSFCFKPLTSFTRCRQRVIAPKSSPLSSRPERENPRLWTKSPRSGFSFPYVYVSMSGRIFLVRNLDSGEWTEDQPYLL